MSTERDVYGHVIVEKPRRQLSKSRRSEKYTDPVTGAQFYRSRRSIQLRKFSPRMWDRWLEEREADAVTAAHLRPGIQATRRQIEAGQRESELQRLKIAMDDAAELVRRASA